MLCGWQATSTDTLHCLAAVPMNYRFKATPMRLAVMSLNLEAHSTAQYVCAWICYTTAIASISTLAFKGRVFTAKHALAGGFSGKNLPAATTQKPEQICGSRSSVLVAQHYVRASNYASQQPHTVDGIDLLEVSHVCQQNCCLDHVGKGRTCCCQDGAHILHDLLSLRFNIVTTCKVFSLQAKCTLRDRISAVRDTKKLQRHIPQELDRLGPKRTACCQS